LHQSKLQMVPFQFTLAPISPEWTFLPGPSQNILFLSRKRT
jgi:hypothetical protein